MILLIVCAVLAAGCVVADKLLPRIPAVERFIRRLPLAEKDRPGIKAAGLERERRERSDL